MMMNRNDVILIIKSLTTSNTRRKLHISLNTRRFYNGFILSYKNKDFLDLYDDKLGHIPILYSQILNIEPNIEK